MKIGSLCSGIEAASVAWNPLGADFRWFSEIAPFQSRFLAERYPAVPNHGDICGIPDKLASGAIESVDVVCGGTPCQAFSLSGLKRGMEDERGLLTLKFIEAVDANDAARGGGTVALWENVEGVLSDKTNAFACFVSGLAGFDDVLPVSSWTPAGLLRGPKRNVAWRVLDAKYFGLPQQRRRLYVIAGDRNFHPENILFEKHGTFGAAPQDGRLDFEKGGKKFQAFREYTDCLYSAYGTKWNGNAAAYNGSLYLSENGRLRRLSPLECERLMGFPDGYTDVPFAKLTNRYQGIGNSWAVPVIRWIGERLFGIRPVDAFCIDGNGFAMFANVERFADGELFRFSDSLVSLDSGDVVNMSDRPERTVSSSLLDVIDTDADEKIFISPVGCRGILRRKTERGVKINPRLESVMQRIAGEQVSPEVENRASRQHRGAFSLAYEAKRIASEVAGLAANA